MQGMSWSRPRSTSCCGAPAHPYTARLIGATPGAETEIADLASIPGTLPDLRGELPPCRFLYRCDRSELRCRTQPLPLTPDQAPATASAAGTRYECSRRSDRARQALPPRHTACCMRSMASTSPFAAGESVGLVGESGCGKSTMVRLLARLIGPERRRHRLRRPRHRADPACGVSCMTRAARGRIQVVFQDPTESLNPTLTVFDAVADPLRRLRASGQCAAELATPDARGDQPSSGCRRRWRGRYPHQLSGGPEGAGRHRPAPSCCGRRCSSWMSRHRRSTFPCRRGDPASARRSAGPGWA